MLSQSDIEWIKANRTELTEGRTETITMIREIVSGKDDYSGEPLLVIERTNEDVIWRDMVFKGRHSEINYVNGVEILSDDEWVSFRPDIDLSSLTKLEKDGVIYTLVTIHELGIGGRTRYECIVRRES
jgi:hypothetical protein